MMPYLCVIPRKHGGNNMERNEKTMIRDVAAALIWRQDETGTDRFMICQRPRHKSNALLWEFVGGKREPGETLEQTLIRECREEMEITVAVGEQFMEVYHTYPDIDIRLCLFHCRIADGEPKLLEHEALAWITPAEIPLYDFCPADKTILERITETFG